MLLGVRFGAVADAATADAAPGSGQGASGAPAVFAPDAFVRIAQDGQVSLIMSKVEMGQGIHTGLTTLVAEELEVDPNHIILIEAPPDEKLYAELLVHFQATGAAARRRCVAPGSRCVAPARRRAPCLFRPPRSNGRSTWPVATLKMARSFTPRAAGR
jgi:isoquinoline 1-oxidoreductase beta subunit